MSFAIIQTGGKQYKVKAGEIIKIEKFGDQKPNSIIEFKEILAYGDDKNVEVGLPTVQGAKVEAEFLKNAKNRTVLIFKKRRRKNSRRKNGHRQQYSLIRVNKIMSKDGKVLSEAEKISKVKKEKNNINLKIKLVLVNRLSFLKMLLALTSLFQGYCSVNSNLGDQKFQP
mgnify:CR=1 FL=1